MTTSGILKAEARSLIRDNLRKMIFIVLVYVIATTILYELQYRLPAPLSIYNDLRTGNITIEQFYDAIRTYGILLSLLLSLMTPAVTIGFKNYCLKIVRKQEGNFRDLLIGFNMLFKVIGISVVTYLFITLWSLLFIFPGIIAFYRYRLAYFILLDDPTKKIMQCINESKHLMHGKKIELFLIDISFFIWYVLNILVLAFVIPIFPVVSILLEPYFGLTQASYYNYIIKEATT